MIGPINATRAYPATTDTPGERRHAPPAAGHWREGTTGGLPPDPRDSRHARRIVADCSFGGFDGPGISKIVGDARDALRGLIPDIVP
jgi:hypothetical protein